MKGEIEQLLNKHEKREGGGIISVFEVAGMKQLPNGAFWINFKEKNGGTKDGLTGISLSPESLREFGLPENLSPGAKLEITEDADRKLILRVELVG